MMILSCSCVCARRPAHPARVFQASAALSCSCVRAGLPIRPVFSKRLPPKQKLKGKLGMDSKLPAVLLVGGGEGMGKLEETVDEMAAQLKNKCQV